MKGIENKQANKQTPENLTNQESGIILQWKFTWELWLWVTPLVHLVQWPVSGQWAELDTSEETEWVFADCARQPGLTCSWAKLLLNPCSLKIS